MNKLNCATCSCGEPCEVQFSVFMQHVTAPATSLFVPHVTAPAPRARGSAVPCTGLPPRREKRENRALTRTAPAAAPLLHCDSIAGIAFI